MKKGLALVALFILVLVGYVWFWVWLGRQPRNPNRKCEPIGMAVRCWDVTPK